MNIYILNGHPYDGSYVTALANEYERAATEAGHTVRRVNLYDLEYDPILHKGYHEIQELEPDLIAQQENMRWCDHMVLTTPMWWGYVPALLKGFFDRAILPGFGFKYPEKRSILNPLPKPLLKGRTLRLIYTQDTMWLLTVLGGIGLFAGLQKAVFGLCGFKIRRTYFDRTTLVSDEKRAKWLSKVHRLGTKGK